MNNPITQGDGSHTDQTLEDAIRQVRLVVFDFDGVFTDNTVYVFQDGSEAVRCWRGDGIGLRKLEQFGIKTLVLSTEPNLVVSVRCRKLGIRCIQGCDDKAAALAAVLREQDLSPDQLAYVGNDSNDLPCLSRVGLPIVVQDAHPDVLAVAKYRTRKAGGRGAVREICDMFEQVRGA